MRACFLVPVENEHTYERVACSEELNDGAASRFAAIRARNVRVVKMHAKNENLVNNCRRVGIHICDGKWEISQILTLYSRCNMRTLYDYLHYTCL